MGGLDSLTWQALETIEGITRLRNLITRNNPIVTLEFLQVNLKQYYTKTEIETFYATKSDLGTYYATKRDLGQGLEEIRKEIPGLITSHLWVHLSNSTIFQEMLNKHSSHVGRLLSKHRNELQSLNRDLIDRTKQDLTKCQTDLVRKVLDMDESSPLIQGIEKRVVRKVDHGAFFYLGVAGIAANGGYVGGYVGSRFSD